MGGGLLGEEFKLKNYNITDIPDFSERTSHNYFIKDQVVIDGYDLNNYRYRIRTGSDHHRYIPIYKTYDKSSGTASGENGPISLLPYGEWKDTHPKWFSNRSSSTARYAQLCYTAHGNEELKAEMINIVSAKVIELFSMETYKDYNHISL